jgi:hypothetical protein
MNQMVSMVGPLSHVGACPHLNFINVKGEHCFGLQTT